jgi:hypothetical protein
LTLAFRPVERSPAELLVTDVDDFRDDTVLFSLGRFSTDLFVTVVEDLLVVSVVLPDGVLVTDLLLLVVVPDLLLVEDLLSDEFSEDLLY